MSFHKEYAYERALKCAKKIYAQDEENIFEAIEGAIQNGEFSLTITELSSDLAYYMEIVLRNNDFSVYSSTQMNGTKYNLHISWK